MHFSNIIVPPHLSGQIYGLIVVGFALSGTFLLGMAFAALYGMGGKELSVTIFFITFYGVLRLYLPPWDDTLDSLFSGYRKAARVWAIDHFTFTAKQEIFISRCCPICLCNWVPGNELVMGRICGHVFHRDCLTTWLSRSTSCPCCRQDLEASDPDSRGAWVQKLPSTWISFGSNEMGSR
jgi:Ring finger domain